MMARLAQERKEHEAVARTQAGTEYQTSTISVKKRKRRVKKKNGKNQGLLWGTNFHAFESKDRKSGEQGLGPEF